MYCLNSDHIESHIPDALPEIKKKKKKKKNGWKIFAKTKNLIYLPIQRNELFIYVTFP